MLNIFSEKFNFFNHVGGTGFFFRCLVYEATLPFRLYKSLIVPTPLEAEELYTQMVFFVQPILTDRYIHRIELWVVSLKSTSSVEYGIKRLFWLSFSGASYFGLILWKLDRFALFLFTFSGIFAFLSNVLRYVKIVKNGTVDFVFEDKKVLVTILFWYFGKILD